MAFQDFDQITERRRVSNKQKFQRRVIIAAVSGVALLAIIGAGLFAAVNRLNHHKPSKAESEADGGAQGYKADKVVRFICNATDYKDRCETALSRAAGSHSPRELVVAAITEARSELAAAFDRTKKWKFASPEERGAFEDCEVLVGDALEELESAVAATTLEGSGVAAKKPELDSWLSAVISYQQTCVDGFPDGKLKNDMDKLFKASKEFTSNSLALVSELSSLMSAFQMTSSNVPVRHLLQEVPVPVPAPAPGPSEKVVASVPAASPVPIPEPVSTPAPEPVAFVSVPVSAPVGPGQGFEDLGFPEWMKEDDRRILKVPAEKPRPNVTVAKDGSGQFRTINEALAGIPLKNDGRYVIYVKEGVYEETVVLTKKMWNVTMYGDGSQKTIITGSLNFVDGVRTFLTASFAALGDGFIGIAMGFRNTAGPEKHQAVAARFQGDRAVLFNCRFEGYQDTLYAQAHRHLYRSCVITGTVDFVFGDAAAVFQNCLLAIRRPMDNQQNIVTAQGRADGRQTTGFVLHRCRIIADRTLEALEASAPAAGARPIRSYLGRPWKNFSRTVVMETVVHSVIHPAGWLEWDTTGFALDTLYYAEYANSGPGAALNARVTWKGYKGTLSKEEAEGFTVDSFLQAGQLWLSDVKGVPVRLNLYGS